MGRCCESLKFLQYGVHPAIGSLFYFNSTATAARAHPVHLLNLLAMPIHSALRCTSGLFASQHSAARRRPNSAPLTSATACRNSCAPRVLATQRAEAVRTRSSSTTATGTGPTPGIADADAMPDTELELAAQRVRQLEAEAMEMHDQAQRFNKEGRFAEAQAAYAAMHKLEDEASALAAKVGCVACVLGDDVAQQVRQRWLVDKDASTAGCQLLQSRGWRAMARVLRGGA